MIPPGGKERRSIVLHIGIKARLEGINQDTTTSFPFGRFPPLNFSSRDVVDRPPQEKPDAAPKSLVWATYYWSQPASQPKQMHIHIVPPTGDFKSPVSMCYRSLYSYCTVNYCNVI